MALYTQKDRLLILDTPLGKDVLLLGALNGREAISRPFRFRLELLSENPSIAYSDIIGKQVSITIRLLNNKQRYINGYVNGFSQGRSDDPFTYYQADVVPWLWFLTRKSNCRIFHHLSARDIVKKIFSEYGYPVRDGLHGTYRAQEYCVEYRETDFNFVSRLMEEHGIFYFFEHTKDQHTLVLADDASAHDPCPEAAQAKYDPSLMNVGRENVVTGWQIDQVLRSGKYTMTDYNFLSPNTSLTASEDSTVLLGGNDKLELFDYPGEYPNKTEGESRAKIRIEEEESPYLIASGSSVCRTFTAGYRFDLQNHYRKNLNQPYVLTQIEHSASVGSTYTTGDTGGEKYSNRFSAIPKSVPFRAPRITPKPAVQGPQTAVVVGKSGEEIWTDKYGRVVVLFHWDRKRDCSCWARVSQAWAGKNWGAINIPRIGQEVIVEFEEGNPDRPIVTGRVYNAQQMPPYDLPDNMTRTTFMTRSTKGGSSSNYNELRFEDKTGSEQVFLHAEKDMDVRVKNDSREYVANDRSLIVKGNQNESVDGDQNITISGNQAEKVAQNLSLQVGQNLNEKSGQNFAHDAGMEIHLKAGMNVVIEAGMELTIKASGGFINIGPAGVAISGTLVLINSGGAAGSGSGSSPQDPKKPDEADDGSKGTKM